jgi:hypothetical protein
MEENVWFRHIFSHLHDTFGFLFKVSSVTIKKLKLTYRIFSNKRPGAFIFRSLFLKKLFNKNAINSHFSFFFAL